MLPSDFLRFSQRPNIQKEKVPVTPREKPAFPAPTIDYQQVMWVFPAPDPAPHLAPLVFVNSAVSQRN